MDIEKYNVSWSAQSVDSSESMPVGGHDIGLNVWVEKGDILFYMDRSGSFDENNQMLKLGRTRIVITPNPFSQADCEFSQELKLKDGNIEIKGRAPGFPEISVVIWVEVYQPVIHVDLTASEAVTLDVHYESWRFEEKEIKGETQMAALSILNYPGKVTTKPDTVSFSDNGVLFYHRNNNEELIFDKLVEQQGLSPYKEQLWNPQKNLTFGGLLHCENMLPFCTTEGTYADIPFHGWILHSTNPRNAYSVDVFMHTCQSDTIEQWEEQASILVKRSVASVLKAKLDTKNWWNQFWERSYISVFPDTIMKENKAWQAGRNYNLFRYMLGCNAFGAYPTKFNGGLFTSDACFSVGMDFMGENPDYRMWGGGSFTAQNQRLVYWPMLKSGDFDLMPSQFDFYLRGLSNSELRTKIYWEHPGCSFTEHLETFGLPIGSGWGWQNIEDELYCRKQWSEPTELVCPWTKYQYVNQLEFSYMILKYFEYSSSDITKYLPFIESAVAFFDYHYQLLHMRNTGKMLDLHGHLVIFPSTACETYKNATNPTDVISALEGVTKALLALPKGYLSQEKLDYYTGLKNRIPPIEFRTIEGKKTIAPAKSWTEIINVEIPQLYPVFPYEIYGIGRDDMGVAVNTWKLGVDNPDQKDYVSWHQDNIFCARLGLTDQAAEYTIKKLEDSPRRFPAFWGPGHDWVPDHNWGGSGMIGMQEMLLQTNGEAIYLLPAWLKDWDVEFKLHAPMNTIIEVKYVKGKIEKLNVFPEHRRKDILVNL